MNSIIDWLPAFAGVILASAAAVGGVRLKALRRERVCESPPQRKKLLRPPGYHLQQKLEEIEEKWMTTALQVTAWAALAGLLLVACFRTLLVLWKTDVTVTQIVWAPKGYVVVLGHILAPVSLLGVGWSLRQIFALADEARSYRLGLLGEMATAEALRDPRIAAAGYTVFHDVPGDGKWNIDHVLVGPAGVFVIETKTRHRRKSTNPKLRDWEVLFDGQSLTFAWGGDSTAVSQVTRNTEWVRRFVAGFAPNDLRIHPVVVLPGSWFVKTLLKEPSAIVVNTGRLVNYVRNEPHIYAAEQLHGINGRFDERCRTVEF